MEKKIIQIENISIEELISQLLKRLPLDRPNEWKGIDWLVDYLPGNNKRKTIEMKLREGIIPGYKQGREWYVKKPEIDEYLESGKYRYNDSKTRLDDALSK